MADQKVERDLPAELQIFFCPSDRQKFEKLAFLLKIILIYFPPKSVLSYLLEVTSEHPRFFFPEELG